MLYVQNIEAFLAASKVNACRTLVSMMTLAMASSLWTSATLNFTTTHYKG